MGFDCQNYRCRIGASIQNEKKNIFGADILFGFSCCLRSTNNAYRQIEYVYCQIRIELNEWITPNMLWTWFITFCLFSRGRFRRCELICLLTGRDSPSCSFIGFLPLLPSLHAVRKREDEEKKEGGGWWSPLLPCLMSLWHWYAGLVICYFEHI